MKAIDAAAYIVLFNVCKLDQSTEKLHANIVQPPPVLPGTASLREFLHCIPEEPITDVVRIEA